LSKARGGRGERLGGLDIAVSNAGRPQARAPILDISTEDFNVTMKTNIHAPFRIIKVTLQVPGRTKDTPSGTAGDGRCIMCQKT
jgi:NAD(P)-dependent dehydrogenase (short-subunit alcohol dehydrogenase family)